MSRELLRLANELAQKDARITELETAVYDLIDVMDYNSPPDEFFETRLPEIGYLLNGGQDA